MIKSINSIVMKALNAKKKEAKSFSVRELGESGIDDLIDFFNENYEDDPSLRGEYLIWERGYPPKGCPGSNKTSIKDAVAFASKHGFYPGMYGF